MAPVPASLRAAAILWWVVAFGFGVFCLPAMRSVAAGRGIPMVMGFPAYGNGPFDERGIPTSVPLLAGFLVVCILEGVAGWLLWTGRREGAYLSLILLPFGAVYWWGFALPFGPLLALAAVGLTVLGWGDLR